MDVLILGLTLAVALGLGLGLGLWLKRGTSGGDDRTEARLRQLAETQQAAQTQMAETLRGQERALANMVQERLSAFSKQVDERLQASERRQQTSLGQLGERLAVIDKAQQNITELSSQVVSLQDILSNKQSRGAFGEVQLHDLVATALPPTAYAFQATLSTGRRADCLLRLPNPPGPIVVDSKFPLESYTALRQAEDETTAVQARRKLSADLRKHVQDIAERYIIPGETAESALLFLPSEAVYAELHANLRNVVEESFRLRVWIVSPTTMMATLNTVRAVLKDVKMREQAGVIQTEVQKLLEDVGRLDDRVGKLQRHFDQTSEDLRQIRISTDKIQKRGERMEDLQLEDSEEGATALHPPAPGG
jgi:DNA recombination protein RmuC